MEFCCASLSWKSSLGKAQLEKLGGGSCSTLRYLEGDDRHERPRTPSLGWGASAKPRDDEHGLRWGLAALA
jgi:hypothetical protein